MRAVGEGRVVAGVLAADVEAVGVGEEGRVAVRGGQRDDDEVARADRRPGELDVARRVAVDDGRPRAPGAATPRRRSASSDGSARTAASAVRIGEQVRRRGWRSCPRSSRCRRTAARAALETTPASSRPPASRRAPASSRPVAAPRRLPRTVRSSVGEGLAAGRPSRAGPRRRRRPRRRCARTSRAPWRRPPSRGPARGPSTRRRAGRRAAAAAPPRPAGATAASSRAVSSSTNAAKRSRTASSRNGRAKGSRWRACSAPSSDSMLGPTTCAVEKPGSSTVYVSASRMTCRTRSRRVTSQAPSAGTQETGSEARSPACRGCGSASSSSSVAAAPSGKAASRCPSASGTPAA